jgi:hypothetical protein
VADRAEQGGAHPVHPGELLRLTARAAVRFHGHPGRGGDEQVDDERDDVVGVSTASVRCRRHEEQLTTSTEATARRGPAESAGGRGERSTGTR